MISCLKMLPKAILERAVSRVYDDVLKRQTRKENLP